MVEKAGGTGQQPFDPELNKESVSMETVLMQHQSALGKIEDPKEWVSRAKEILSHSPSTKGISENKIDEFLISKSKKLTPLKQESLEGKPKTPKSYKAQSKIMKHQLAQQSSIMKASPETPKSIEKRYANAAEKWYQQNKDDPNLQSKWNQERNIIGQQFNITMQKENLWSDPGAQTAESSLQTALQKIQKEISGGGHAPTPPNPPTPPSGTSAKEIEVKYAEKANSWYEKHKSDPNVQKEWAAESQLLSKEFWKNVPSPGSEASQKAGQALQAAFQNIQKKISGGSGPLPPTPPSPPKDWDKEVKNFVNNYIQKYCTGLINELNDSLLNGKTADFSKAINNWLEDHQEISKNFYNELYKIPPANKSSSMMKILQNEGKDFQTAMNNTANTVNYMTGNSPVPSTWTNDYNLLKKDGVTVVLLPNGHIWPKGGFKQGTSESFGYTMLNAVQHGDKPFFEQLMKSYAYFCGVSREHLDSHDQKGVFGLLGWGISYEKGQVTLNPQSATDADQDIIASMIQAIKKWPDLSNASFSMYGQTHTLKQIIISTISSFAQKDINGDGYLNMGNTTHLPLPFNEKTAFPDYFHSYAIMEMLYFLHQNDPNNPAQALLQNCMSKEFAALTTYSQKHDGWIFDSWSGKGKSFGGEAIRLLWTLPWFLEFCRNHKSFVSSSPIYQTGIADTKLLLTKLVSNILKNFADGNSPSTAHIDPNGPAKASGVGGATLLGPLYFAMLVLKQEGDLPTPLPFEVPAGAPSGFKNVLGITTKDGQTMASTKAIINYVKKDYMFAMRDQFSKLSSNNPPPYGHGGLYFELQFGNLMKALINNYGL